MTELTGIAIRPTVIIGIGGSGYEVVLGAKERILANCAEEQADLTEFLVIDTEPESPPVGKERLAPDEFLQIGDFTLANEIIDNLDRLPLLKAWWPTWNGAPYRPSALGVRAPARLALYHDAYKIAAMLDRKIRAVLDIREHRHVRVPSLKIHIVAGLAGGTGSGLFLDLTYLARQRVMRWLNGLQPLVAGVLVMPDAYEDLAGGVAEVARMRANAFGALLELNHFYKSPDYREQYHRTLEVDMKGHHPFDDCFVVGRTNGDDGRARRTELLHMVGAELMLEVASPPGMLDEVNGGYREFAGQPAVFNSFAVSALDYPGAASSPERLRHLYGRAATTVLRSQFEETRPSWRLDTDAAKSCGIQQGPDLVGYGGADKAAWLALVRRAIGDRPVVVNTRSSPEIYFLRVARGATLFAGQPVSRELRIAYQFQRAEWQRGGGHPIHVSDVWARKLGVTSLEPQP